VAKGLDAVLSSGASVNMYMAFGGTNFGFHAGSDSLPTFRPGVTSSGQRLPHIFLLKLRPG
jgi:beta-galactosidase